MLPLVPLKTLGTNANEATSTSQARQAVTEPPNSLACDMARLSRPADKHVCKLAPPQGHVVFFLLVVLLVHSAVVSLFSLLGGWFRGRPCPRTACDKRLKRKKARTIRFRHFLDALMICLLLHGIAAMNAGLIRKAKSTFFIGQRANTQSSV